MTGGDLNVAQVDARVEHDRHESLPPHVRVHAGQPDAGRCREVPHAASGGVAVHA